MLLLVSSYWTQTLSFGLGTSFHCRRRRRCWWSRHAGEPPIFWLPPPTVGAEGDDEDSVPELNKAVDVGLVVLDADPIFWLSANFLSADDDRPNPLYNPPLSKSDDVVANEKAGVQIHELLLSSSDIGIETGSIKTIVRTIETSVTGLTKRLGEVDYTEAESLL